MTDHSTPAAPGRPLGRIDRVRTGPAGLNVAGWTRAGRVTLFCGGRSVSARPDLPRPDTAAQLGLDPDRARVGYDLTLPDPGPGPAVLVFDPAPGQPDASAVLPVPGTGAPRRAPPLLPLLPRRVAALFDRYAAEHLDCARPGPALTVIPGAEFQQVLLEALADGLQPGQACRLGAGPQAAHLGGARVQRLHEGRVIGAGLHHGGERAVQGVTPLRPLAPEQFKYVRSLHRPPAGLPGRRCPGRGAPAPAA